LLPLFGKKNGKSRVYFKVLFSGSTPVDCGYIDGETGHKGAIQSRPVSWGQYLAPQVTFTKATAKEEQEAVYNTGFGYYGTAADAARGFDGIE
jgi:hypothetical protein